MTKPRLFLLFLPILLYSSTINAKPFLPRLNLQKALNLAKKPSRLGKDHLNFLRAGDIGPIKASAFAKAFSILTSLDAISGIFFPTQTFGLFGVDIEKGSVGHFFCEVIGAQAAGLTVTSFLAPSETVEKAIGYGHLARLSVLAKFFVTKRFQNLGIDNKVFALFSTALSFVSYCLLTGKWNPLVGANAIAYFMMLAHLPMALKPEAQVRHIAKFDLEAEGPTSIAMARFAGMYTILGGLHTAMILQDVDPVKAVGYTSLAVTPFLYYLKDFPVDKFLGIGKGVWTSLAVTILGVIAAGTLL